MLLVSKASATANTTSLSHKPIKLILIISYFNLVLGCGESETSTNGIMPESMEMNLDCGPNGDVHDNHCHCDPGYRLSEDEMTCEAEDEHDHSEDEHDHSEDEQDHSEDEQAPDQSEDEHDHTEQNANSFKFENAEIQGMTAVAEDGTRVWNVLASQDGSTLSLEIYEAFGGPSSPGVVEITEAETNYATCGTCIVVSTGCEPHGDHVHCAKTFMPKVGGQLRLDEMGNMAGEQISGALMGVEFQEVSISSSFQTEAVEGSESMSLQSWSFNVQLEAVGNSDEECGGHGSLHGDHCHCDPGYQLDPNDSTQCIEV